MNTRIIPRSRRPGGFTLVEIMIVVAILGIILSIAVPTWIKQRVQAHRRVCQENLVKIDGAKEQWAMENKKAGTDTPQWFDLVSADGSGYIKKLPHCPAEGTYDLLTVNDYATCTVVAPLDHNAKE